MNISSLSAAALDLTVKSGSLLFTLLADAGRLPAALFPDAPVESVPALRPVTPLDRLRLTLARRHARCGRKETAWSWYCRVLERSPQLWNRNRADFNVTAFALGRVDELVQRLSLLGIEQVHSAETMRQVQAARERGTPSVFYASLPKTATSTIFSSMRHALDIPMTVHSTNLMPDFRDHMLPRWLRELSAGGAFFGGHSDASAENVEAMLGSGLSRALVHVRDPRQSVLSLVHHYERFVVPPRGVDHRQYDILLTRGYRHWPLERKIQWTLEHRFAAIVQWIAGWVDFQEAHGARIPTLITSYEEFVADKAGFFERIFDFLGLDQALAQKATEHASRTRHHFRKGQTAEWRQVFSPAQAEMVWRMLPERLRRRFGWER